MMSTSDTTTATSTTTTSHDPPPPPATDDQTSTDQEEEQHQQPVEYLDSFPVGYRFNPTDKELLHYLTLRYYQKQNLPPNRINEVNLYDHHPEYLTSPGRFKAYENEEWYFFTPRDRKYRNGDRPKRSAGGKGYWKATGVDRKIFKDDEAATGGRVDKKKKKIFKDDKKEEKKLGSKKTLVYYEGKPPHGIKTCWVMHEFKLDQTSIQKNSRADMLLNETVLCRIHIKKTKSSDNSTASTTSSGSRKKKSVHHADHSLSSPTEEEEEEDDEEQEDLQEEGEEEEEALSVRGREIDVYNDMEDEHLICSNYDSTMQQYSPTDLHEILNNNSSCNYSTTAAAAYSSNIMDPVSSFSTTTSTAVCGAANIMPLQTCHPTCWVTAPELNDFYMDTSTGIVATDMVSHNSTYSNINIRQGVDDQIQQQWETWMSSLSSALPAGHPRVSSLSSFVPAGHPPPPPQILIVPQGCSLPPLSQMSPPQMQQQGYHHQYSSSWADHGNNNIIDGSSGSGINYKLHDHEICHECGERHMASKENDTNISTTEPSEYLNAVENLEGFDQTPFSNTFNGSTLPDCGWSRR